MFNVGGGEFLVVLLVALLVLGPDKLPEYSRKAARVVGDLRRISQGFQNEMRAAMNLSDDDDKGAATSAGPRLLGPPPSPTVTGAPGTDPVASTEPAPEPDAGHTDTPDEGTPASGSSAA